MTTPPLNTSSNDESVVRSPDEAWSPVLGLIRHQLEMTLARHPAVGKALTFAEGEKLISELSSRLAYDIRYEVDPAYEK